MFKQPDIRWDDIRATLRSGKAYVVLHGSDRLSSIATDCTFVADVVADYTHSNKPNKVQGLTFTLSGMAEVGITKVSFDLMFRRMNEHLDMTGFVADPDVWLLMPDAPKPVRIIMDLIRDNPRIAAMYRTNSPEPMVAIAPVTIEWDD